MNKNVLASFRTRKIYNFFIFLQFFTGDITSLLVFIKGTDCAPFCVNFNITSSVFICDYVVSVNVCRGNVHSSLFVDRVHHWMKEGTKLTVTTVWEPTWNGEKEKRENFEKTHFFKKDRSGLHIKYAMVQVSSQNETHPLDLYWEL